MVFDMNSKQNTLMIQLPLLLGSLLYGGFYNYCVYATGVIILFSLVIKLGKDRKSRIVKNEIFYGSVILCISAIIGIFVAVNKGMAWLGFLRVLVIAIWIFFLMQFTKEERDEALNIVPWIGGTMVLIGIISSILEEILPDVTELFWQADRFGGIFQYSNTCALFLLIAMLLLAKKENVEKKELILFDLLLLGLFLTGSKGGMLLLIPVFIWILINNKLFRKNGIVVLVVLFIAGIVYATTSGNFQNIGRIYTLFNNHSTLYGRLLYMKDALPILIKNPLGIGYMGYSAMQSSIQTGVYTSIFVHNDWIQIGLDYGWLFLIVSVVVIIKQLIKGQQDRTYKIILLLICIYSFMEFHLQYLSIVMIIFLLFDFPEKVIIVNKKIVARENQIFAILGIFLLGYFTIQSLLMHTGSYKNALAMYPYDTQAKEALLKEEKDKDNAVAQAAEILELDSYSADSYNVLAYSALMDGNYKEAIDYKLKVVEIKKYNMTEYSDFIDMLEIIQKSDDSEYTNILCRKGQEKLEQLLEDTEENTSSIAYKLRDKPAFIRLEKSE